MPFRVRGVFWTPSHTYILIGLFVLLLVFYFIMRMRRGEVIDESSFDKTSSNVSELSSEIDGLINQVDKFDFESLKRKYESLSPKEMKKLKGNFEKVAKIFDEKNSED